MIFLQMVLDYLWIRTQTFQYILLGQSEVQINPSQY